MECTHLQILVTKLLHWHGDWEEHRMLVGMRGGDKYNRMCVARLDVKTASDVARLGVIANTPEDGSTGLASRGTAGRDDGLEGGGEF